LFVVLCICSGFVSSTTKIGDITNGGKDYINDWKKSSRLKSICLDQHADAPANETYQKVLGEGVEEIFINGQKFNGGLQGLIGGGIIGLKSIKRGHS
jgi:hypothetical protein